MIDGAIRSANRQEPADKPDSFLDPDAIAQPLELTGNDQLPIPKFLTLNLTVEQVFGWLKVG